MLSVSLIQKVSLFHEIGGIPFNLVQLATDQISVQRYLSAKSIRSARNGLWLKLVLTIGISLLSYVAGTVLFAYYNSGGRDDPVAVNLTVPDQILPYFAVNALPVGVPGVIVAAIFAATMSTTSSGLNAIATALSTDFARTLTGSAPIRRSSSSLGGQPCSRRC